MKTVKWYRYLFALPIFILGPYVIKRACFQLLTVSGLLSAGDLMRATDLICIFSHALGSILSILFADRILLERKPRLMAAGCGLYMLFSIGLTVYFYRQFGSYRLALIEHFVSIVIYGFATLTYMTKKPRRR